MSRSANALKGAQKVCADCDRRLPIEEFAGKGWRWDKAGRCISTRCGLCRKTNWKPRMLRRERIKTDNR